MAAILSRSQFANGELMEARLLSLVGIWNVLTINFRVDSFALEQSYDCLYSQLVDSEEYR